MSGGSGSVSAQRSPSPPPARSVVGASSDGDDGTCGICFDASLADGGGVALRYCGHHLCISCYRRVWEVVGAAPRPPPANAAAVSSATTPLCPFCRSRLLGYYYLGDGDDDDDDEEDGDEGGEDDGDQGAEVGGRSEG